MLKPIAQGISDHNPFIINGIISWNLWAPCARNGHQIPEIERQAMQAVNHLPYPDNVAPIIQERLIKEFDYLIHLLKNTHRSIDAICLQEVADKKSYPQLKQFFFETLNKLLKQNHLDEFIVMLDENNNPISDNKHPLLMHTVYESFALLILPNKKKLYC